MKFAKPNRITARRAARATLGLIVGGAALFAYEAPWRRPKPPADLANKLSYAGITNFGPSSWRYDPGSLDETLRLAASDALQRDSDNTQADIGGGASPLLAYEAAASLTDRDGQTPAQLDPSILLGADTPAFLQALAAYKAGDFAGGDAAVATLKSGVAATAAQWAGLRAHPREAGFARLQRFMSAHADWPAQDWLRRRAEEGLFGDHNADATIKNFFSQSTPQTPAGKLALARVLSREGEFETAGALVRDVWRESELNDWIEGVVRREFADFLTPADHKYRVDRLLYAEKNGAALRIAELAGKDVALLARVRAAANNDYGNEKLFATVPPSLQNDPGLLFARVHLARKQERIAEAGALLLKAPRDQEHVIDGDAWWTERRMVARKLLDIGDARTAYAVCAQHLAHSTSAKVEAEFHSGWIALRFLNDLPAAERHFDQLAQIAETPIQKSRAAYWRARAAEARNTPEEDEVARTHYKEAAAHSTTFYGQLALTKLGSDASPVRPAPQAAEGDARDESVRVVELLFAAGEKESASALAADAAKHLGAEAQVAALGQTIAHARDAKMSLTMGKLASYRGVALDDIAFPTYGIPQFTTLPGSASRSIVYAIARQESAFDPRAVSSAGAMGLMQMIASTARSTASRAHLGFDLQRMLSEPAFNAQLGAAHLGTLLYEHKGSYLLTFAAYNAGGKRVKEWIDAYGDPRHANVDPIDWVERIPISETRNYVQRVMENFVVYRAKFQEHETREPSVELARVAVFRNGDQ
jgi:soluble lytic murein transglycosylase